MIFTGAVANTGEKDRKREQTVRHDNWSMRNAHTNYRRKQQNKDDKAEFHSDKIKLILLSLVNQKQNPNSDAKLELKLELKSIYTLEYRENLKCRISVESEIV